MMNFRNNNDIYTVDVIELNAGYMPVVKSTYLTQQIPLLMCQDDVNHFEKMLTELPATQDLPFDTFAMVVAGCALYAMKRREIFLLSKMK